jgi:hypothetical protein
MKCTKEDILVCPFGKCRFKSIHFYVEFLSFSSWCVWVMYIFCGLVLCRNYTFPICAPVLIAFGEFFWRHYFRWDVEYPRTFREPFFFQLARRGWNSIRLAQQGLAPGGKGHSWYCGYEGLSTARSSSATASSCLSPPSILYSVAGTSIGWTQNTASKTIQNVQSIEFRPWRHRERQKSGGACVRRGAAVEDSQKRDTASHHLKSVSLSVLFLSKDWPLMDQALSDPVTGRVCP